MTPNADHQTNTILFCWCNFNFQKCLGVSPWSNHWAEHLRLSQRIHFLLYAIIRSRMNHSKFAAPNTPQNVELFDFHWIHVEAIYRDSLLCQFSWDDPIFFKCWHPLSEIRSMTLWSRFRSTNVFRWWLSIADERPVPSWSSTFYAHCMTSEASAVLSNHR